MHVLPVLTNFELEFGLSEWMRLQINWRVLL